MKRYAYDFHLHSCLSPCADQDMTPNNIVRMAKLLGIGLIAITDHNSCKNCAAAQKVGEREGVLVLPGMELCTAEEIHAVCLFEQLEAALAFGQYVEEHSLPVRNRPEIFGEQLILDEYDREIGREESLLIAATSISINEVDTLVPSYGGAVFPAHIDKESYSILSCLGAIPEEAQFSSVEFSRYADVKKYSKMIPEITQMNHLFHSDAHMLESMDNLGAWVLLEERSAACVLAALSHRNPERFGKW